MRWTVCCMNVFSLYWVSADLPESLIRYERRQTTKYEETKVQEVYMHIRIIIHSKGFKCILWVEYFSPFIFFSLNSSTLFLYLLPSSFSPFLRPWWNNAKLSGKRSVPSPGVTWSWASHCISLFLFSTTFIGWLKWRQGVNEEKIL